MSDIDPGRLPFKAVMRDAQREAERKAQLYTERHLDEVESAEAARGVRHLLRRLRDAVRGRG